MSFWLSVCSIDQRNNEHENKFVAMYVSSDVWLLGLSGLWVSVAFCIRKFQRG